MLETRSTPIPAEKQQTIQKPFVRLLLEWRIVAFAIVITLLITAIPYIYAVKSTPPGYYYTGLMLGVPDHLQYFSWMRDLSHQTLASNRLTPEPNTPAFFNLLWWAMGRIGAVTGMDVPALYALLRFFAVSLCLSAGYAFYSVAVDDLRLRRLSFLIFAFGGGLGIIWLIVKYALKLSDIPFPDDVYTSEANTFFISLSFPHFTLATGLLTATFAFTLQAMRKQKYLYAIGAGAAALLLGLQHTYDLITVYAVLGLFGVLLWVRDRRFPTFMFLTGLIVAGMSGPPALYMFLLVKLNPIWGAVLAQFNNAGVFTPNLLHLFILLGIPFWLALVAFRPKLLQSKSDTELFVGLWFVAHFGLAYIPTDFQIHMLLGWQVPMAILAATALTKIIAPWITKKIHIPAGLAIGICLSLAIVTNIYIVGWRMLDMSRHENPYFLNSDEVGALNWLKQHSTQNDVVLADLSIGQFVPMWTDSRAFLAHWANTLDYYGKIKQVKQVMDPATSTTDREAIIKRFAVTYIVTRDLPAPTWATTPEYQEVFRQGSIAIYQVSH